MPGTGVWQAELDYHPVFPPIALQSCLERGDMQQRWQSTLQSSRVRAWQPALLAGEAIGGEKSVRYIIPGLPWPRCTTWGTWWVGGQMQCITGFIS
jgi:hypothetical protein